MNERPLDGQAVLPVHIRYAFLSQLAEGFPDGFWSVDGNGKTIFANAAMATFLGVEPNILAQGSLPDFCDKNWANTVLDGVKSGVQLSAQVQDLHYTGPNGVAKRFDVHIALMPMLASGESEGVLIFRDKTDLCAAIDAQAHLAAIVNSSDDAFVSRDMDGYITSWNASAEWLFGYSAAEAIGKQITVMLPSDRPYEEDLIMGKLVRGEQVDHFETVRMRKDGSAVDVSVTVSPIRDSHGNLVGASRVARDITVARRAEETNALLAAIVESSDDAIISKDLNGTILTWNRGAEALFGYSATEVIGKRITILLPEERHPEEDLILNAIRQGEKVDHLITTRLKKSGELIDVFVTVSPVFNSRGEIIGASKVARDISVFVEARRQQERWTEELERLVEDRTRELRLSAKEMESFAHAASHDLRAPLRTVELGRRLIGEALGDSITDIVKDQLDRQANAVERMNQLITDLLNSARVLNSEVAPRELDLSSMVHSVWYEVLEKPLSSGFTLKVDPGMTVWGDPMLIRFVLQNLLQNAVKFSPSGGTVTVSQDADGTVAVRDEGIGFDMKYAEHLFEPFHRLVRQSEFPGTGIGLSNAKRICERHRGSIWADSRPGEGASFFMKLPLQSDESKVGTRTSAA